MYMYMYIVTQRLHHNLWYSYNELHISYHIGGDQSEVDIHKNYPLMLVVEW